MKLSSDTLSVLKNFGSINQGLLFKQGKTLKTVSSHKNILAEVTISEEIPTDFGVYDLNNFLSVVSLHKDDTSFDFDEKHVVIVGNKGRSKIKYRFCDPTMINTPPEKPLTMPEAEITFKLTSEDFDWILRAASVLSSPQVAIESDGTEVNIVTIDLANDGAHTDADRDESRAIGICNDTVFRRKGIKHSAFTCKKKPRLLRCHGKKYSLVKRSKYLSKKQKLRRMSLTMKK